MARKRSAALGLYTPAARVGTGLIVLVWATWLLTRIGLIDVDPDVTLALSWASLFCSSGYVGVMLLRFLRGRWATYVIEEPPRLEGLRFIRFRLGRRRSGRVEVRLRGAGAKNYGAYATIVTRYGPSGVNATFDHDGTIDLIRKVLPTEQMHKLVLMEGITDPDLIAEVMEGAVPVEWAVAYSKGTVS